MTRKWGKKAPHVFPRFADLRELPPHILLVELHKVLCLDLSGGASSHYEGLSQAAKDARRELGAGLVTKLQHLDFSAHLVRHLTPESCSILVHEVRAALHGGDGWT